MIVSPAEPFAPRHLWAGRRLVELSVVRAQRHPTAVIAATGFAASVLTVLAGGRAGTVRIAIPLTTWFGTLSHSSYRPGGSPVPGLLLLTGIVGLVLLWLSLARR